MKTFPKPFVCFGPIRSFLLQHHSTAVALWAGVLALTLTCLPAARAADVEWDGPTATSPWRTATNWLGDVVPGATDNAVFGGLGTVTICTLDMGAAGGIQQVGAITFGAGRIANLRISTLTSSTANGVLQLNGVGGILLSNESTFTMTLTNGVSGATSLLGLRLAASGDIYVANNGTISIGSIISETGGARGFTKRGPGELYLRAISPNLYSGDTYLVEGDVRINATATFGTGTLHLDGGRIVSANTRGSAPIDNPVFITADTIIYGDSSQANERIFGFSGPWSGSAGTVIIGNLASIANSTFTLRLVGGGTFPRPISIGSGADTPNTFKILEVYNPATNGLQVFNEVISGTGTVRRSGDTSTPGGMTSFTADNTYQGGTVITYGTLLANNTTGTAFGSGSVIVTNQGVVGGVGTITSPVSVSFGGAIAPGSLSTNIGTLNVTDITLGESGGFNLNVTSATGTPGVAWDLINVGGGGGNWTDAATSVNPFLIKIQSTGAPAGWNSTVARDWLIIDGGAVTGFDANHFAVDTTGFGGAVAGVFSLSVVSGDLHLIYTPAPDVVLNVPSGSQTQGQLAYPALSGTVGVIKVGAGEAVLTNSLNDYAGLTRIYAGTVSITADALNGAGTLGAANSTVVLGDTTSSSNVAFNIRAADVTMGRNLVVQSGSTGTKTISTTITSGSATNAGDITLNDAVTLSAPAGGTLRITGSLSGAGGISKVGAGTVALNAANTFTGKTVISNGVLSIDAVGRLGALPGSFVADQVTLDGGTLEFTAGTTASGGNRGFQLGANGGTFNVIGGTLTLSGPVSGPGSLTKTGTNRLDLNSLTNTYAGDTFLNEGEIGVDEDGMLGMGTLRMQGGTLTSTGSRSTTANFIPNPIVMTSDTVIRNSGGTSGTSRILTFGGSSITTSGGTLSITNGAAAVTNNTFDVRFHGSGFNFTRPIVLDGGPGEGNSVQFFLGNSNGSPAQTFSGVISGTGKVRRSGVVASDAGTTIFTAANTYTGGTIIFGGTLLANNTTGSATGPGSVLVTNLGTLGGTGTIAGPVTVMTNGSIAPGTSAGTLTLQNGFDANAGGTYVWELAANSTSGPGSNFDVLAVTGGTAVMGGASKLALAFTGSATAPNASDVFWQSPRSWTILTLSGGASNPGTTAFATITNTFTAGTFTNYADVNGNIVLAFTPSASAPPQPTVSPVIAGAGTASATVSWSSVAGYTYTVQYKTNLNQVGWLNLGTAAATGPTTSIVDNSGPHAERYYRVVWP
jgi:fibronectin-binding autotransporter adhesin